MKDVEFSRRFFLATSALASVQILTLSACKNPSQLRGEDLDDDRAALELFAQHLFPVSDLSSSTYSNIVGGLFKQAEGDPVLAQTIDECLFALNKLTDGDWAHASAGDQIAAISNTEGSSFFSDLYLQIQSQFCEHPDVWAAIGYGGPSLHLGGYIDRGFDDIDWLPETLQ